MDAVEFVKNYRRLCQTFDGCYGCPCHETAFCSVAAKFQSQESAEEVVQVVEKWAAAHPVKTRQSVFLEQWPEASVDECGTLQVCPYMVSVPHRNMHGGCATPDRNCTDCRREFWMQEVE